MMDPATLAAPCTNSMLEPFRRAIEAAVPGQSPEPGQYFGWKKIISFYFNLKQLELYLLFIYNTFILLLSSFHFNLKQL